MSSGDALVAEIKSTLHSLEICQEHLENLLAFYTKQEDSLDSFEKEAIEHARTLAISRDREGRENLLSTVKNELCTSLTRLVEDQQQKHLACLSTYTERDPKVERRKLINSLRLAHYFYKSAASEKDLEAAVEENARLQTLKEVMSRRFEQRRSQNLSLEKKCAECGVEI
ncbi:unnamed protein product [Phytomonas sp. Hart1]|nr:unnamed protein product [Phytomonas sp. Hart1]|eukprot:CCW66866.1 unnamed protein product [Phytomonas sp. isolate Hart1]